MKPLKGLVILITLIATSTILLSSFYPFSDNRIENASESQKFLAYYSQIHEQNIPESPQNIFIIPKSGCPYCEKKLIGHFFSALKDSPQRKNNILIAAGLDQKDIELKNNYKDVQPDYFDPENNAEKYGLYFTSPIWIQAENQQIQSIIHTVAGNIDSIISILDQKRIKLHTFHSPPSL